MVSGLVGARIRTLRLQRRLTLKDVADKAGITSSALSQIERNRSNPSLSSLKAISSSLGTTIGHLIPSSQVWDRLVVRATERKRLSPRREITYELLTPDLSGQVEFILSLYEPVATTGDEAFAYPGEQCGVVLNCVADITPYDTVHHLRAGDSIRFDCSVPHRIASP
jgi:transcriptional regulator with XRE-family HTH domain